MEITALAKSIRSLDANERMRLLLEIIEDENVSITELVVAKTLQLEDFKKKAIRDMPRIAEAGLELGEKEMRKVTGIKGRTRKKTDTFNLAMVKCLIDARGYYGTEYGKQIASVDFSSIDTDWYEQSWQPQTYKEAS
jgi:hypothetical protein